jgi:hypothetical protein
VSPSFVRPVGQRGMRGLVEPSRVDTSSGPSAFTSWLQGVAKFTRVRQISHTVGNGSTGPQPLPADRQSTRQRDHGRGMKDHRGKPHHATGFVRADRPHLP